MVTIQISPYITLRGDIVWTRGEDACVLHMGRKITGKILRCVHRGQRLCMT